MRWVRAAATIAVLLMLVPSGFAGGPKVVAFTFDDGPRPKFLAQALPILEKEGINATFFAVGKNAKAHSQWIERLVTDGHEIENHSYTHRQMSGLAFSDAASDILKAQREITALTGRTPIFFRPPFLDWNRRLERYVTETLGLKTVIYGRNTIASRDDVWWRRGEGKIMTSYIMNRVIRQGDRPYVILFHENPSTLEALPQLIRFFKSRGYHFVTLEVLLEKFPNAEIKKRAPWGLF